MITRETARRTGVGAIIVFVTALLLAATTAFILVVPVDASNFETTTGVSWDAFAAANPEAADYLTREARILAVGYLGFTLLVAAVTWWPLRRGDPWAARALWLFPATLLAAAVVFLSSDDGLLGGMYLGAGAVTGIALVLAGRRALQ